MEGFESDFEFAGPVIKYLSITIKLDSTFLNGHCFLIKVKSETFSGKKYGEGIHGPVRQSVSSGPSSK